jgi:hypothetical protein
MKQMLKTPTKTIASNLTPLSGVVIAKNEDGIIVRSSEGVLKEVVIDKKHISSFNEKDDVVFNVDGVLVEHSREMKEVKPEPKKSGNTFCKNI